MEVVRFSEAPFYTLPDHEQITARRLQGADASGADFVTAGYSEFPPHALVPMGAGPIGKIYIVTEGVLVIEQDDGVRHMLGVSDSIFIPAHEARAVRNDGDVAAAMIVLTPPTSR